MKRLVPIFLILCGTLAAEAPKPVTAVARLYRIKCAGCHGADGSGGAGACLTGKLVHNTSKQLFDVIKSGVPGTPMPPSGLPDPMIKEMVGYVRSLSTRK